MPRSFSFHSKLILLFTFLQTSPLNGGDHLFRNYTTTDGLPDSRVSPIIQDRKGYMWFGTQAGLTRYDGQQFVNFSSAKDVPGIFGRDIIEDRSGGIWFAYTGFARGGVLRLHNGIVQDYSSALNSTEPGSLTEDAQGRIWVGSTEGITRISILDSTRTHWTKDHITEYSAGALFTDRNGTVWIGTNDGRLIAYRAGEFFTVASGLLPNIRTQAIFQDRAGRMWFGGIFGILMVDGERQRRYSMPDGLPARGVWSFCEDNDGNFWVGTSEGLYRKLERDGKVLFQKEKSFGGAIIYDMCLDAEGNVWFASDPGIRRLLAPDVLVDFPHSLDLATAGFGPVTQSFDGSILFGSRNSGLFVLSPSGLRRGSSVKPGTTLTILSIFPENQSAIWYGIKGGGVFLQKGAGQFDFRETPGFVDRDVYAFSKYQDGNILIGTSQGLWRYHDNSTLLPLNHPAVDSLTIFDISPSAKTNEFWIATDKGIRIVHVENNKVLSVATPDVRLLQERIVYSILIDHNKRIWMGTDGGGLVFYNGDSYRQYTTDDGLVGNRVFALAEDSLHSLWVGTSAGLSQFDGSSFRSFTHDEGFREIGLHGLFVDDKGMLWVSNFPGIAKINPRILTRSTRPPPVYITHMEIDTSNYANMQSIEVDPNPAVITFRYAGLSFTDERNVRYKYRLRGFDKDWSSPVTTREVRYTHLGSGAYIFEVLARSADGVWSRQPASIEFAIHPPFYARWWFILLTLFVVFASIYALYRYRLSKALEMERTRSRIAMDLHDDIGSSLTRISVLSEVAQRQVDAQSTLARIGDTARELIDTLGDIVWSVDPKHDDLQNVVRRIAQFGQDVCNGKEIIFETDIRSTFDQTKLSIDQRRDVYLLFKEALNNVVRHANASTVRFFIREEDGKALLSLIDDGIGINDDQGAGHGLSSMKERAQRAGGTLSMGNHDGQGTTTTLTLKTG